MEVLVFEVIGQVVESVSGQPVGNLKVEAWDKDVKYDDLLGQTYTDSDGRFSLTFDSTYFREMAPDEKPDLFFRVFLGKRLLKSDGDKIIKNAGQRTRVTIHVEMPEIRTRANDKISMSRALNVAAFMQQSDFKGLFGQYKEKAGTSFGFLSDMVANTIAKMDLTPVKAADTSHTDVVGQDVQDARATLENNNIVVNEVKPYDPKLNAASFSDLVKMPLNLRAGQKVNLYEENGKIRYYSIEKATPARASATPGTKAAAAPAAESATITKLSAELQQTRKDAAAKDKQINKLQKDLETLRKDHEDMKAFLNSDTMVKLMKTVNKTKPPKNT